MCVRPYWVSVKACIKGMCASVCVCLCAAGLCLLGLKWVSGEFVCFCVCVSACMCVCVRVCAVGLSVCVGG